MNKYLIILLHIIFWIVYFLFSSIFTYYESNNWDFLLSNPEITIINFLLAAFTFYSFYYYFLPKFLQKEKYLIYFVISVIFSVVIVQVFMLFYYLVYTEFNPYNIVQITGTTIVTFLFAQLGSLFRGFVKWFDNMKIKAELENRNLRNELSILKSQINPHFFFNTLNNIDSLIIKKSEDASKALVKLSEIMRYILYGSDNDEVDIISEVKHIENVISLQNLRLESIEYISFFIRGNMNNTKVAPLIFLPFIENAFKYSEYKDVYPVIEIEIKEGNEQIEFVCNNYFDKIKVNSERNRGGVGLKNVKRRLELIYPERHTLNVKIEDNKHMVNLVIQKL